MESTGHEQRVFIDGTMDELGASFAAADASCGHTFCIQIDKVLTSPPLSRGSLAAAPFPPKYVHALAPLCVSRNLIYYRFLSHESVEQLITHTQRHAAHMGFFPIRKMFEEKTDGSRTKKKNPETRAPQTNQ